MSPADANRPRFVTRAGEKLQGALDAFGIDVRQQACLDVGASHGGFTDCLLKAGARRVMAVDVGWGLLDFKLRQDPRVQVLERTHIRILERDQLAEAPTLVTVDVSFISLLKVLPFVAGLMPPGATVLAMAKPQFEAHPRDVPKGIVRDEPTRQRILNGLEESLRSQKWVFHGRFDCTVKGRQGNQETFFYLKRDE